MRAVRRASEGTIFRSKVEGGYRVSEPRSGSRRGGMEWEEKKGGKLATDDKAATDRWK